MTLKTMAVGFFNSPEFKARYGALSPRLFVIQLYQNVLGREPDRAGLTFHELNLALGKLDHADTLVSFAESRENINRVAARFPGGGSSSGGGTTTGSASDDTDWSNYLFVDSDKAVQVRFRIYDRSGNFGTLQAEYSVNTNDRIHCRFLPTKCTHYVLVTNHLGGGMESYLLAANAQPAIVVFKTRQLKFDGGYELKWDKQRGIVHTRNGVPTGSLWSTDCVDDIFPGTPLSRTRCPDYFTTS